MARRKRGEGDSAAPAASGAGGGGVHMDVRVSGPADKVRETVRTEEDPAPKQKPEPNGQDEKVKFLESLRNPKYLVKVKRVTPREFHGKKTNFEVFSSELPLSLQDIMDETARASGGGKFRAAVMDPEQNTTVAAYVFDIEGDPMMPDVELTPEERAMFGQDEPREKDAATLTEEGLERQARLTAKQIEYENLQHQLSEARASRKSGNIRSLPESDNRINDLQRQVLEAKHQAELEARDRKHAEEMRELREMIAANQKPAKPEGQSEIALLITQMQRNQEASDKRFEALQKQMQDDKLNALLEEIKAIKNKPQQQSSMLEMADAMLKMKKLMGWGDDDEDEDVEDDPEKPWYERLADRVIPKLLEKFDGMEDKGQKVTREDFMREMAAAAKVEEDAAVARAQARIVEAQRSAGALPAPVAAVPAAIPPPPNPPVPGAFKPPPPAPAAPVSELPPPPPAPAAPAPTPAEAVRLSVEQEITLRVSGVLEIISREIELRPNEYLWNYEGVWQSLPEELREKIAAAADPVVMFDAFAVPNINPDMLDALKKKVADNPRITSWLKLGLDELKEWTVEKQKDPTFDPMDDGGEEEVA